MTTFEYYCEKCDENFEVYRQMQKGRWTLKELEDTPKETGECPKCKNISNERVFSASIQFIGTSVESPEYNPALGQVVKNTRHRKELAKRKGLVEIGNEKPETLHKHYEKQRADKRKKQWDDV